MIVNTENGPIEIDDPGRPVRKATEVAAAELGEELATYQARLPELLAHEGEYVLIKGKEVVGFYETSQAAQNVGYRRLGMVPMFIKRIAAVEPVIYIPNAEF